MKKMLTIILLTMISLGGTAQVIRIGLYHDEIVKSVAINITSGEYMIKTGGRRLGTIGEGSILFATLRDSMVSLHDARGEFGVFKKVELSSLSLDGTLRIRPVTPALESRSYDDGLILEGNDVYMTLINQVDFDKYIAGVLEAEVGPNAHRELYKAHALLTRTYMLNHFDRHREEGFSLCDGVHCQAYHGRAVYNPQIAEAVFETSGEVVVDYHYKLITAAYHSNSGGETQRAADVWLKDVDYLQAVLDPYSLHQPSSKWYDTIPFDAWKEYLVERGMESAKKVPEELLYVQQRHRRKHFVLDGDTLMMTRIREDWGWRSTFFNMFPEADDKIVVWGKGYGHGVGLSQEGAMNMASQDFSYKDIIKFYFFNIRIMHYEDLPASSLPDLSYE